MRLFTFFLLTVCRLPSIAAEKSMHQYPRDVPARVTTTSNARATYSSDFTTKSSSRTTSNPTTSLPKISPKPSPSSSGSPKPTSSSAPPTTPHPANPAHEKSDHQQSGLTQSAKIGLGVGIPLAVASIVGVVAAYVIGKRRGRKRRVSDPTAGAGQRVRDPSDELNFLFTHANPPGVVELSAAGDGVYSEHPQPGPTLWKDNGAQKYGRVALASPPHSPQELPA